MTAWSDRWPAPSPFGVLGPGGILTQYRETGVPGLRPGGPTIDVATIGEPGELGEVAKAHGLRRVFVHESALGYYGEEWTTRGGGVRLLGRGSIRPIERGPEILIPALSTAPKTFAGTRAPIELRWAVELYERALQWEFRASAGATGESLLVAVHERDPRGVRLPPAEDRSLELPEIPSVFAQAGAEWIRELTPTERGRAWVHGFDKRAAYLAAAGSDLELGIGELEEIDGPGVPFDHRLPGWWRCELAGAPGLPPALFAGEWHPTAIVELAVRNLGQDVKIDRALVWPRHVRYLAAFAKRIRRAMDALEAAVNAGVADPHEYRVARAALGDTYKVALGGRLASRTTRGWVGYRPDWKAALVALVAANMVRAMIEAEAAEAAAFALKVDALYVTSHFENPADVPGPWMRAPDRWRWLGRIPVATAAKARTVRKLSELVERGRPDA